MPKITRRQFWRINPAEGLKTVLTGKGSEGQGSDETVPLYFRPPGAMPDEKSFLATCERCNECADACPYEVIGQLGPGSGPAEGTPVLRPETSPCQWCPDFDCIDACPSGALSLGHGGVPAPIGKAVLNLDNCLVSQGILCEVCADRCPSSLRAIKIKSRFPVIDEAACTGCGLCSYYCAAETTAITIRAN